MVDGAKWNSHDSGTYFKKSTLKNGLLKEKFLYLVTELKLQERL